MLFLFSCPWISTLSLKRLHNFSMLFERINTSAWYVLWYILVYCGVWYHISAWNTCFIHTPSDMIYTVAWGIWHFQSLAICLFVRQLIQAKTKNTWKLCIAGPFWFESLKMATDVEGVSMSWHFHVYLHLLCYFSNNRYFTSIWKCGFY